MAKALFGHVGTATDQRMRDEVQRLRITVQALEFEVARLKADNDRLMAGLAAQDDDLRRITTDAGLFGDPACHREYLCQLAGLGMRGTT